MFKTILENLKSPKRIVIFFVTLFVFFLIDWLTKHYLFDSASLEGDYKVIGIRSLPHDNSTIFSSLKISMPLGARIFINLLLAFIFTMPVLFTRSTFLAIGLGVLVGGILGNALDIIPARTYVWAADNKEYAHYVRDVFYTPWADRGTFNAADVFIVFGAGLIFVRTFIEIFKKDKKELA